MSRKQRNKRARAKSHSGESAETTASAPETTPAPQRGPRDTSINKLGLVVSVVVLVGLFGVVLFLGDPPPPDPAAPAEIEDEESETSPVESWTAAFVKEIPIDRSRDFIRGPEDAAVSIVEFTDFECPYCKIAHTYIQEIVRRYPNDVRLVLKNFPLDTACNADLAQQIHPFGCKAAVMARCAGARDPDLFWQFHDAIFESDVLSNEWLDAKAAELGVVGDAFQRCVSGSATFDEVRADIALARELSVYATPTLFVNGRAAPSYEIDALSEIIDHILASN